MIQSAKRIAKAVLRVVLTPLRMHSRKRNGTTSAEPRMELPNSILLSAVRDAIREGHTATILVKGWSMRPFLEHLRDKVLLDSPADIRVGDAVLAEITPGHFVLHRIIAICGDEVTLMGDGNLRGTESCKRTDVCGVVRTYIRPGRSISADDPALVRRIRLWRRLLPVRRLLLLLYKSTV